jgi:hypothetical protein
MLTRATPLKTRVGQQTGKRNEWADPAAPSALIWTEPSALYCLYIIKFHHEPRRRTIHPPQTKAWSAQCCQGLCYCSSSWIPVRQWRWFVSWSNSCAKWCLTFLLPLLRWKQGIGRFLMRPSYQVTLPMSSSTPHHTISVQTHFYTRLHSQCTTQLYTTKISHNLSLTHISIALARFIHSLHQFNQFQWIIMTQQHHRRSKRTPRNPRQCQTPQIRRNCKPHTRRW